MYKILYFESGSGFGGSARSLNRLIKAIDRRRFHPFVMAYGMGPPIQQIQSSGVEVIHVRPVNLVKRFAASPACNNRIVRNSLFYGTVLINAVKFLYAFRKIAKIHKINIIHLNNGIYENLPGLIAAILWKIPCVSHIRGTEPITHLEKLLLSKVRRIITLNPEMQSLYTRTAGAQRVTLVHNGIDLNDYPLEDEGESALAGFCTSDACLKVGAVGRLVEGKGFDDLILAAARVSKALPDARFFIVGNDPHGSSVENRLKKLAGKLSLNGRLVFTGWRNDIVRVLQGLDMVVQAATYPEGLPTILIEAMALEKPVVATRIPGHTEVVEDGISGLLVPPGDHRALADAIITVLTDHDLYRTLALAGRRRVEAAFTSERTARRIEQVYIDVLQRHQRNNNEPARGLQA